VSISEQAHHRAARLATSRLPVLRRSLGDSWRSLVGWSIGVTAAIFLYVPLFPSLGGKDSQMAKLIETLPPQLVRTLNYQNLTSGGGYVESTFFGLLGFVFIVIAATAWGTAAIAGDEESGGLELTLAHGVSRRQVVLERAISLVLRLAWLALLSFLLILALNTPAQLELTPARLAATAGAWLGLALLSGTAALMVGALTGRKLYATAAGAGVAVYGYVLNAIGNQQADLDWLRDLSPYGWAYQHTPLISGVDWGGLGLLYGFSILFLAVAVVALVRRDLKN
jgi:ABC-2 type transport system permease protein